jgi:hypothetical protein
MRKAILLVVAVVFLVLALGGVALAATPQDIYDDYAADGKLDGTYTDEELEAYLADGLIDTYGDPAIVAELDALVTSMLGEDRGEFPFTGAQLFLIALVAVVLVGGGVGLRRLARSRG